MPVDCIHCYFGTIFCSDLILYSAGNLPFIGHIRRPQPILILRFSLTGAKNCEVVGSFRKFLFISSSSPEKGFLKIPVMPEQPDFVASP